MVKLTLQGKYNYATVFTENIEESAIGQVIGMLNEPITKNTTVIITALSIYKPTILDNIFTNTTKTQYETNVDKNKYELSVITNNNEKYLKFDNKGDNNIQIRNNNKKVNTDIFKIVAENDNEYLLEYEVVDKGFFTDTVKQERSSLKK